MPRHVKYAGATEIFECSVREARTLVEREASRYLNPTKYWAAHHAALAATKRKRLKELTEYVTKGWVGRVPPYEAPLAREEWNAERQARMDEKANPLSHFNLCQMADRLGGLGYGMIDSGSFPHTKTLVNRLAASSGKGVDQIISAFNERYPEIAALLFSTRLFFQARARREGRRLLENLSVELCERLERMPK